MTVFRHRVTGPGPAGDIWVSTLHSSSSQSITTVHAAWQQLVQSFGTVLATFWSPVQQATEVVTDELDAAGKHNVAQARSAVAIAGTGAGNPLDQRACVVVGLRTAVPTRAGRGRMYWPAPDDANLDSDGLLLAATASNISAEMATDLATMAGTAQPVIYHRALNTFTPISTVTVSLVVGTQRRRTNKVPPSYQTSQV